LFTLFLRAALTALRTTVATLGLSALTALRALTCGFDVSVFDIFRAHVNLLLFAPASTLEQSSCRANGYGSEGRMLVVTVISAGRNATTERLRVLGTEGVDL